MAEEQHDETTKPAEVDPPEPDNEFPDETWVTDENWVDDLNVRWRKVIDELMNGSKIYESYAKAYDIETSTPKGYNLANACGSRLLRNGNFRKLWKKVIEERGFNDETADMRLVELMRNPDPSIQMKAVKHYNELSGRVIKKLDHTSDGKRIEVPAVISTIMPRDETTAQAEATDGN